MPRVFCGDEGPGLVHAVPWARVLEAHMTQRGSLGKALYGQPGVITDPLTASMELGVNMQPMPGQTEFNHEFLKYESWANAIFGKMIDHLADNFALYPQLQGRVSDEAAARRKQLLALAYPPTKAEEKADYSGQKPGTNYIYFKAPLYRKAYSGEKCRPSPEDARLLERHGVVRDMVPVFDAKGKAMPWQTQVLAPGDVVSVCGALDSLLLALPEHRLFVGMRRRLLSATLLMRAPAEA